MIAAVLGSAWVLALALAVADGRRPVVRWLAVAGMASVLACVARLTAHVVAHGPVEHMIGDWPAGVGIMLRADALGSAFALVTTATLLAAMAHEAATGVYSRGFPALVAFLTAGLNGLFLTGDVFNFYVCFELSMTAAVALAAYHGQPRELRAAFTFAVVNLLGSVFFLAGTVAIYHVTGSLDMRVAGTRLAAGPSIPALVIAAAFFVAFGVKLGLFPFHFWVPPVYRDADPAAAAILSGAVANIGSYGLLRFGGDIMPGAVRQSARVLLALAVASILYGGVLAISRRRIPEVLAYSSIGQAGYVLLAVSVGGPLALAAGALHAMVNSLNKTLLFLVQSQSGPFVAGAFAAGAASVAGLPPSAGFFGKAALFRGVAPADSAWIAVAAIAAGSLLSLTYMSHAWQRRFWAARAVPKQSPLAARLISAVLALVIAALGLWPEALLALASSAGAALESGR